MKYYLLFSLLAIMVCSRAHAQVEKTDSVLAVWVNDLAKHSLFPCDAILKMEKDSALRIICSMRRAGSSTVMGLNGESVYPMDSASVHFYIVERIVAQLLNKN
jgi:hypothetical protein